MEPIKCFMLTPVGEDPETGHTLYRREDTREVYRWLNPAPRETPVGAMWWCPWLGEYGRADSKSRPGQARCYQPTDGKYLAVRTPGGTWIIDSRCSNCTMPNDNVHHCWVRHGEPPDVTVDKNGITCAAGAGSIQCNDWHGFLVDGYLTDRRLD